MSDSGSEIQSEFLALRGEYLAGLPRRIQFIEDAWVRLRSSGLDGEGLSILRLHVHRLTGSAATFGFAALAARAREVEQRLDALMEKAGDTPEPLPPGLAEEIAALLASARNADAEPHPEPPPREVPDQAAASASTTPTPTVAHPDELRPTPPPRLYVIEDDPDVAELLALKLRAAAYQVRVFYNLLAFERACAAAAPAAALVDIGLREGEGTDAITDIQGRLGRVFPVVFISGRTDLPTRIRAVRAGGHGYFTKPVDMGALLAELDRLTGRVASEPYRVVVVEDDETLARHYAAVVEEAGMAAEIVTDPYQSQEVLDRFHPEVILMDLNMPGCSGTELTTAIRQQPGYQDVPILFVSGEENPGRQTQAIMAGADEFLQKPVSPLRLVRAITTRAQRLRALRGQHTPRDTQRVGTSGIVTTPPALTDQLDPGTMLPGSAGEHYEIVELLARGGMGITYVAQRASDRRRVVVKCLLPEIASDMKVLMRFLQEARVLLQLDHPNLVKGYDVYQGRSLSYYVMDYIDGTTVDTMLRYRRILPVRRATEITLDIARGLEYLEAHELVHRDVKPENIMVATDGRAKLVDFGIVKTTARQLNLTTTGIVLGTPAYLSPEQAFEVDVDIRSDIYSLGASYYQMITGSVPFEAETTMAMVRERLKRSPDPRTVNPSVPGPVSRVVERMMHRNVEKRYQSTTELVRDLEGLLVLLDR